MLNYYLLNYRKSYREDYSEDLLQRNCKSTQLRDLPGQRYNEHPSKQYMHHEPGEYTLTKKTYDQTFFNFEPHRTKLCKIFFRNQDLVQYGSTEYYDFWKFLKKYQDFERSKSP